VKTRLQPGAKQILNWDWMKKIELGVDEIEMNRSKKNCQKMLSNFVESSIARKSRSQNMCAPKAEPRGT
jgi:hypothetical protein